MLREGRKVQTNFDLVGRVVLGLGNVLSSSSWSPLARVRLSFSQNIHMHSGEVMVIFRHFFSVPWLASEEGGKSRNLGKAS